MDSSQQISKAPGPVKQLPGGSEESELKIRQDKLDSEKVMSFMEPGSRGGVSITFSDRQEQRRDGGLLASPGAGPGASGDCLQSQLAAVKLKLEQKRKKIEDDKKKMEVLMSKQREKVGQEAFLRAVAKGMEKPPKDADCDQERKPFILNQAGPKVSTPDTERTTLDLCQLQRGLQKLTAAPRPQLASSPHREPFFISQQQQQLQPQPPPQAAAPVVGAAVPPYYMYPGHHAPPPAWYGMVPYHPPPPPYYPAPGYPPHPHHLPPPPQLQSPSAAPPHQDKPAPLTDKPSLSSSFLEMKRCNMSI